MTTGTDDVTPEAGDPRQWNEGCRDGGAKWPGWTTHYRFLAISRQKLALIRNPLLVVHPINSA